MHTSNVSKSLDDIDSLVRKIIANMDKNEILIITSDHGKQENGQHKNCDEENEIVCNSIFFAYSKKGFIQDEFLQKIRRKEKNHIISSQAGKFSAHESMISNTISNILNISISFINSGRTLFEIYPSNTFEKRIEFLQRVLQDSFSTLQQQKQLYQKIQSQMKIFSYEDYQQQMDNIKQIENQLYYEQKEEITHSETKLEKIIQQIVQIQDEMQEKFYNTLFISKELLIFGIIFGFSISLLIVIEGFIVLALRQQEKITFLISLILIGISLIYYLNEGQSSIKYGSTVMSFMIVLLFGFRDFKRKYKLLLFFMFIGINCALTLNHSYNILQLISSLCESIIFGYHSLRVLKRKKWSFNNQKLFLVMTILIIKLEFYFMMNQMNYFCLATNLIFYLFSFLSENLNKLSNFKKFSVDIIVINIFCCFFRAFSKTNFIVECSNYYPIAIVNIYLLCIVIKTNEDLFNSYFLQFQVMIYAGFMFKQFGFQYEYAEEQFSFFSIGLFYFPFPLIIKIFKNSQEINFYKLIPESQKNKQVFPEFFQQVHEEISYETDKQDEENLIEMKQNNRGVILFCSISLVLGCIGQLMLINKMKMFNYEDDIFIFQYGYIFSTIVSILLSSMIQNQ